MGSGDLHIRRPRGRGPNPCQVLERPPAALRASRLPDRRRGPPPRVSFLAGCPPHAALPSLLLVARKERVVRWRNRGDIVSTREPSACVQAGDSGRERLTGQSSLGVGGRPGRQRGPRPGSPTGRAEELTALLPLPENLKASKILSSGRSAVQRLGLLGGLHYTLYGNKGP